MKKKTDKVICPSDVNLICLYCGQKEKRHWDEYTSYYECDCEDVVHNEKINKQIAELKTQLRRPRFKLEEKTHLVSAK